MFDPQWQITPLAPFIGISVLFVAGLFILGWRHRESDIGKAYLFFMSCSFIWISMSFMEMMTLNLDLSLIFADISFIGIAFVPISWIVVIFIFNNQKKQLKRIFPLLIIIPILTNLIIWTNSFHSLWRGESYRDFTITWFPISFYDYGIWFYAAHVPYTIGVTVIGIIILIQSYRHHQRIHRLQILFISVSLSIVLATEILYQLGYSFIEHYNTTTLIFPFSGFLVGWTVLRQQFFTLSPIAREMILSNMDDLIIVIDHEKRVRYANPMALKRLFSVNTTIMGKPITMFMPDQEGLFNIIEDNAYLQSNIQLTSLGEERIYALKSSPIIDDIGYLQGYLILLDDITIKLQMEQVFLNQERQVATLEERQRLARELHDSVNQTLFAAKTMATLLPKAFAHKPEKVPEYAQTLEKLIDDTLSELRLVLFELSPEKLLASDISNLLQQISRAYTSATEITVHTELTELITLPDDVQIAFYRISQEALQNISKHSRASEIYISLTEDQKCIVLTIKDNGDGFYIEETEEGETGNFGLQNMRDRAKEIDAKLTIDSKVKEGTIIKLAWER